MRFKLSIIGALSSALCAISSAQTLRLDVGSAAPNLHPEAWVKGAPVSEFQRGRVYVLMFWSEHAANMNGILPAYFDIQNAMKGRAQFIGISTFAKQFGQFTGKSTAHREKLDKFVKENGAHLPPVICADDENDSIGDQWLPLEPGLVRAKTTGPSDEGQHYLIHLPYAAIVNQDGIVAWMGNPVEMRRPLEQITQERFNLNGFKRQFDAEIQSKAAEHQLYRDIENAAKVGDKNLFDGLIEKMNGYGSRNITYAIDLGCSKNPEFALTEIESRLDRNREVMPVMWLNSLCIVANNTDRPGTQQRAGELADGLLKKCDYYALPYGDAMMARIIARAGRKDEALEYLAKARELIAKFGSPKDRAQLTNYVDSAEKAVR